MTTIMIPKISMSLSLIVLFLYSSFLVKLVATANTSEGDANIICTDEAHWMNHPALCTALERLNCDEDSFIRELELFAESAGLLVDIKSTTANDTNSLLPINRSSNDINDDTGNTILPVVLAHGMGDSCYNNGMKSITDIISKWLNNTYTVCIPTGKTHGEDTKNGYFLSMNDNIEIFAEAVMNNTKLSNGFHAIGFSQGNNIIRGYIAKYNTPTVHTFISINGVNAGVGAVPYCRPKSNKDKLTTTTTTTTSASFNMCDVLMEQASHRAYTEFAQEHSFQANYWRDPRKSMQYTYRKYAQLATLNNEVNDYDNDFNETLRINWLKTQKFVWILAENDEMVWPKEGEWWGAPNPDDPFSSNTMLAMNETEWYVKDLFGLKTAQENNKNYFESFIGDHLQFNDQDLKEWITKYIIVNNDSNNDNIVAYF